MNQKGFRSRSMDKRDHTLIDLVTILGLGKEIKFLSMPIIIIMNMIPIAGTTDSLDMKREIIVEWFMAGRIMHGWVGKYSHA